MKRSPGSTGLVTRFENSCGNYHCCSDRESKTPRLCARFARKVAQTALKLFQTQAPDARQRGLIQNINEQDAVAVCLGNCTLSTPGLQKLQQAEQKEKRQKAKEKEKQKAK